MSEWFSVIIQRTPFPVVHSAPKDLRLSSTEPPFEVDETDNDIDQSGTTLPSTKMCRKQAYHDI